MTAHLPALLLALPLFTAFLVSLAGLTRRLRLCLALALAGLGLLLAAALATLRQSLVSPMSYWMSGWRPPLGIELVVAPLNAMMVTAVALVGLANAVHSARTVARDLPGKIPAFYTLYLLLVTALTGMSITGDAFNLYVFLEISALSTYGLVALGGGRALMATFHYIMMGTIGASFYLLGVGYLYIKTGSLNLADLQRLLPGLYGSETLTVGFILMMVGLFVKMALFPLHGWLPNAYTYAPHPTSALVGPLATKVAVFVMLRLILTLYTPEYVFGVLGWHGIIVALAVVAVVAGTLLALRQRDLKRMIAYVMVAEAGYMAGGIWLGEATARAGAAFHLFHDALATLCLFLVVGNIAQRTGSTSFESLGGLFGTMPVTAGALALGGLAVIGVPPTSGFFSKWYLIWGALQGQQWLFAAALLFASLANAVLFFRVLEIAFLDPPADDRVEDAPPAMLVPTVCSAVGLLALGLGSGPILSRVILPGVGG